MPQGHPWWDENEEPANKGQSYPAEILTRDEIHALIRACSGRSPTGIRNRAWIATLAGSGLRISEASALLVKDVDLDSGVIHVLRGKGAKRRTAAIDGGMAAYLDLWIARRRELAVKRTAPVFCTLTGGPVAQSYLRRMLKEKADRAGIDRRVHPHGLRHSFAYQLMMKGVPVTKIQRQLGHDHLQTTSIYLDHLAPADVVDAVHAVDLWGDEAA